MKLPFGKIAWSEAKANFSEFIFAQADLLRARLESMKTE